MSQLTLIFLGFLLGPMAIALVIVGSVILLEKREERYARPYQQLAGAPPPPSQRAGRPPLTLVRN